MIVFQLLTAITKSDSFLFNLVFVLGYEIPIQVLYTDRVSCFSYESFEPIGGLRFWAFCR